MGWKVILGLAGSLIGLVGGVIGTSSALKNLDGLNREQKLLARRYLGALWAILIIPICVLAILVAIGRVPAFYLSLLAALPLASLPLTLSANSRLRR